jgi:ATP-dependent DNA helicase RecG
MTMPRSLISSKRQTISYWFWPFRHDEDRSGITRLSYFPELLAKARAPSEAESTDDRHTEQVTAHVSDQVMQLLRASRGEQSRAELMEAIGLTHREHFRETYLLPALAAGYLEMTIPDKPKTSRQKYRLTLAGQTFLNTLPTEQP